MPPILVVRSLSKAFGGVRAVDGVDFDLEAGEIRALIGPNGSGKTTLLNLLSGLYSADSGRIEFLGHDITRQPPHARVELGMARTFQVVRLFPGLTVAENVRVGLHCRTAPSWPWQPRGRGNGNADARVRELLATVRLASREKVSSGSLTHGEKRFLEMARALASGPQLILLDEPSAGMTYQEISQFLDLLHTLQQRGVTTLMIEHNMLLVMKVAQRISVLNFGCKIAEGTPEEVRCDPQVIDAYLGEE